MAVNNLLGTASINLLLLAVADLLFCRDALTSVAARPGTLMQGVLTMTLGTAVAMLATIGDIPVFGVGLGTIALLLSCIYALRLAARFERRHVWEVASLDDERDREEQTGAPSRLEKRSLRHLALATAACALVILVGGFFLSTSADAFATQTGLASGMVGFLLVGFSTSLPELSSVVAAVRIRRYEMAVGDVFGTNLFNIALIFLADAVYRGEPVLDTAGEFEVVGALLAVLMTGIFAIGLLERRDRTILRMGPDSLAAFATFALGVAALVMVGRG